MSWTNFKAAFVNASKSANFVASAQRTMDGFYSSKCKELKKAQDLEDTQTRLASEMKKHEKRKSGWEKNECEQQAYEDTTNGYLSLEGCGCYQEKAYLQGFVRVEVKG